MLCLHCGKEEIPKGRQKYCSNSCVSKAKTLAFYYRMKETNPEKLKEKERLRSRKRRENPEYVEYTHIYAKTHRENNKEYYATKDAKRRAAELNAIPLWADLDKIKLFYTAAKTMCCEVDHIIPLQHKLVCGLHVADNLQLLHKTANRQKGNKFAINTESESNSCPC